MTSAERILIWTFILFLLPSWALAAPTLPYTVRTKGYSGLSNTLRGDIQSVGMAGATIGLASTLIDSLENPAGLAMTLPTTGLQAAGNKVYDEHMQDFNQAMTSATFVVGGPHYPWGFSMGFATPGQEGARYEVGSNDVNTKIKTSDFTLSAARLFAHKKLSVGVAFTMGQAGRALQRPGDPSTFVSQSSLAVNVGVGLLYQFPNRWLLGLVFHSPRDHQGTGGGASLDVDDFYQEIHVPYRVGLGIGHIPNRCFRFGVSVYYIGSSPNAYLLSDQTDRVGGKGNFQPRIGARYQAVELQNLKIAFSLGSYYEISRVAGKKDRIHGTSSVEFSPWVLNLGFGLDLAGRYQNYIYSIGVNVLRLLDVVGLVDTPPERFQAGWFPPPFQVSDWGLPRALVHDETKERKSADLFKVGSDIKKNLNSAVESVDDFFDSDDESKPQAPAPKSKPVVKKKRPPHRPVRKP